MIFRLYDAYNKHEIINLAIKSEKNRKYHLKCSNAVAADCIPNSETYLESRIEPGSSQGVVSPEKFRSSCGFG